LPNSKILNMIYYINVDNEIEFKLDDHCPPKPLRYNGIYISHLINSLSVDNASKRIDYFVNQHNLHGSEIMFGWESEGYQHIIINFINDVTKELITNYSGYNIDMFHYNSGVLFIDKNIEYYKSLPFDFLPNNLWLSNTAIQSYTRHTIDRKIEINTKLKKFLSMNGEPRTHRRLAINWLIKNDLLKESFYSFNASSLEGHSNKNNILLRKYDSIIDSSTDDNLKTLFLSKQHNNLNDYDRIKKEDIYYFDNSYFSLVQETFYDNLLNFSTGDIPFYECIFITEKTYRPIYFKHPFIVLGVSGTLAGLKQYGFKTFSPYFDESYDDIADPVLRLQTALNEVKRLCSLSNEEWLTIQRELLPILEYNYDIITSFKTLTAKRK